jgi:flagellar basal body P-ring protein FlgI
VQLKNVAAVLVTAQLPAFARPGQMVDVNVSSLGNSKSLKGGMLISTPMRGVDGEIYALAQGNLIVGGAGASAGGSKVQINHLSAGPHSRWRAGRTRSVPTPLLEGDTISLGLTASDFQTAQRVAQAINRRFGEGYARALDGRTVEVRAPVDPNSRVSFIAEMEELHTGDVGTVGQGRHQRAHRLDRAEPGGHAGCLRDRARQPVDHDQLARRSSASPIRCPQARPWWRRSPTSRSRRSPAS